MLNGSNKGKKFVKMIEDMVAKKCTIHSVSASLLSETIYLLRKNQPNKCPEWVEGIGDCKLDSCEFCRTEECIDALESNVR